MNQTSVPGSSLIPATTDLFTAGHLAIIGVLAVLVVIGLLWGVRNARARRAADREVVAHNEAVVEEKQAAPPAPPTAAAPGGPLTEPPTPVEPATSAEEVAPAIAATPPVELAPAAPAIPSEVAPPADAPGGATPADGPVTQLKGLGPKLATKLAELGITTVGQLAALTDDEAAALDARLGAFTGRMNRDRWLEQARFLAAGDRAGFEAVFGRL